jgi:hypothetical protein
MVERGLRACAELARRRTRGEIWVAGTARLLEYLVRRDFLSGEVRREGDLLIYSIRAVDDPLRGTYRPSPAELEGLTLYCDDPQRTEVRLADQARVPTRINPPDPSGRASVTVTGP